MAFSIDEIFPNFTLFVLIMGPILIVVFYLLILLSRWLKKTRAPRAKDWAIWLNFAVVIYMSWPIVDIYKYITGEIDRTTLLDLLFGFHLANLMMIIVLVGLGQIVVYARMPQSLEDGEEVATSE